MIRKNTDYEYSVPGNDHEDGDIMIATDDSKEENEKFDSVRLVSEVFKLSASLAIVLCLEMKTFYLPHLGQESFHF